MHQASPGVERAIEAARSWADRLGSARVRPVDLVLALLDEDEGRPAVLLERLGLVVADVRERLARQATPDDAPAPTTDRLFDLARNWSLAHRADPSFTTDTFLIAVLTAEPEFDQLTRTLGFGVDRLQALLATPAPPSEELAGEPVAFVLPGATAEMDTARVLDANLNRAREALRVLEDYCRFTLDDRFLTEQVKSFRHELTETAEKVPHGLLVAARETQQDVGTAVSATGEYVRTTPLSVATVNLKRLQESLRSLEEYGKIFNPNLGREFESHRYRAYTLERAMHMGGAARGRLDRVKLYLLVSGAGCVSALDWTIGQAATGGVDAVQLREKALGDRELIARARSVRQWTRKAGVLFIVNDRPDVARLAEADGVHLGQDDFSVKDARRFLGPDAIIGVSTHSIEQLRQAVLDGADYVGLGPTFPSKTKSFEQFPGLAFVRAAVAETSLPAFALGGIGPENIADVVAAGARRVAVSSAITQAADPEAVSRVLRVALDG